MIPTQNSIRDDSVFRTHWKGPVAYQPAKTAWFKVWHWAALAFGITMILSTAIYPFAGGKLGGTLLTAVGIPTTIGVVALAVWRAKSRSQSNDKIMAQNLRFAEFVMMAPERDQLNLSDYWRYFGAEYYNEQMYMHEFYSTRAAAEYSTQ